MKGEGITFYFPEDSCSPFSIQRKGKCQKLAQRVCSDTESESRRHDGDILIRPVVLNRLSDI